MVLELRVGKTTWECEVLSHQGYSSKKVDFHVKSTFTTWVIFNYDTWINPSLNMNKKMIMGLGSILLNIWLAWEIEKGWEIDLNLL